MSVEDLIDDGYESQHVADRNRVPSEEELEEAKAWLNSLEEKLNECPEVCNK